MLATDKAIFSFGADGATRVLLAEPRQCSCGHMVAFAVNRDGKTRCVECDARYVESKSFATALGGIGRVIGDLLGHDHPLVTLDGSLRIPNRREL